MLIEYVNKCIVNKWIEDPIYYLLLWNESDHVDECWIFICDRSHRYLQPYKEIYSILCNITPTYSCSKLVFQTWTTWLHSIWTIITRSISSIWFINFVKKGKSDGAIKSYTIWSLCMLVGQQSTSIYANMYKFRL